MVSNNDNIIALPLHRAPFYFAPHFLASVEEWRTEFTRLIMECAPESASNVRFPFGGRVLQADFGGLIFTIDAHGGIFSLDDGDDNDGLDDFGIDELPKDFLDKLKLVTRPPDLSADIVTAQRVIEKIYSRMMSRFERAVAEGAASFHGRVSGLFAALQTIDRVQFSNLNIDRRDGDIFRFEDDWRLDSATASSGERVFAISVRPNANVAVSAFERSFPQKVVGGRQALVDLMRGNKERPPLNPKTMKPWLKPALRKYFVTAFGAGRREFDRWWEEGIKETSAKWDKSGRK